MQYDLPSRWVDSQLQDRSHVRIAVSTHGSTITILVTHGSTGWTLQPCVGRVISAVIGSSSRCQPPLGRHGMMTAVIS